MSTHINPPAIYGEPSRRMLSRQDLIDTARMALAELDKINAILDSVIAMLKTPPSKNNSAATGRQYGGDKPGVPNNPAQPVTGEPRCGAGGHPGISHQASGRFSQVGTYRGVPIYAYESMDDDQTLYAVTSGCGGQPDA